MRYNSTIILLVCAFLTNFSAHGQKNVVKLNVPSLAIGNLYASYEHALSDKKSVSIGLAFMPSRSLLFKSLLESDNTAGNDDVRYESLKMSGFSITPEFRFYTARRKEAPRGFYLAPYLRYQNLNFKGSYTKTYYDDDYQKNINGKFDITGSYNVMALGCQFGVQWLIADRFSIDWSFIGIGVGAYKLNVKESSQDVGKSYYEDNSNINFDNYPGSYSYHSTPNSGEATVNMILPHFRSGLSLGYAF